MAGTRPRDPYEVLGVARDADETQIKKAFRRLARELHPDVNRHDPDAEEKFKEAAEAYEVLSDPEKRRAYDTFGHEGLRGNGFAPGLAFGFFGSEQSDGMSDRDASTHRASEQPMDGKLALSPGQIVGGELHSRLGVRVALDRAIHARVQFGDLAREGTYYCRREMMCDDLDGRCGALAEIAAEIAPPILERRRLTPPGPATPIGHLHQHVSADRLGEPRPFVLAPRRQRDVMKLDFRNGRVGHAPTRLR